MMVEDGTFAAASVREDGEVLLRDPLSGEKLARTFGRQTGRVVAAALAPDGSWVAIAGERMVRVWDPATGRPIGEPLRFLDRSVCAVAPVRLPDGGSALAVGLVDARIQLWDFVSGVLLGETEPGANRLGYDTSEVRGICALPGPGGPRVVASSKSRGVRIWTVANILGSSPRDQESAVSALAAVPRPAGEPLLACAYGNGTLDLADTATGVTVRAPKIFDGKKTLAVAAGIHQGTSVMAAAVDGGLVVVDLATERIIYRKRLDWGVRSPKIVLTPDGGSVFAAAYTSLLAMTIRDEQGQITVVSDLPYVIKGMAHVSVGDESAVAVILVDGTVHRFNSTTREKMDPIRTPCNRPIALSAGTISDDRPALIAIDGEGTIVVLDPATGARLLPPIRSGFKTYSAATGHNRHGQLLAALGSSDGAMTFIDIEQGREVAAAKAHLGQVTHITVVARTDGPLIVSGGADGCALAWEGIPSPDRPSRRS
nr:WD40 repeat domain-containing protein [Actinokineospora inagensis]